MLKSKNQAERTVAASTATRTVEREDPRVAIAVIATTPEERIARVRKVREGTV